jgi:DNA mismatch repair protein MutS2
MDRHTLDKLQFEHVRASLADCCACTLGKRLARKLDPSRDPDVVRQWFDQVRQMEQAFFEPGMPPLGGVSDIRPHIHDAAKPAGLEPHDLRRVGETLAATSNIARWREELPETLDLIRTAAQRVSDFGPVAAQIDRAIDERGRVRDDASGRLLNIRRTTERLHEEIKHIFARILRRPDVLKILQFPNATTRNERTVLPLKTEYRGQLKGIVHHSSDTGSTLFIEPAEAVEANNAIVALKDEERKEIARILAQLSLVIHQNGSGILATLEAIGIVDLIAAKVRYLKSRNAVCPDISDDQSLLINEARHPVLLDLARAAEDGRRTVVPIDVRLGDDFDVLIITGPNTGGKTVSLKTIGLLAIMTQCGIPIPAAPGSRLPVYHHVFVDIGDEQSIEQSLSTFSSHLSNILHVIRDADAKSLVLLDELGSGTDPDEGAAIGRTIIEELIRIGCGAVVTTHLSALKSVAFTNERVDNASVEFDVESLRPTFRLRLGEPGNSNAITIAQRLGMSKRLVKIARSHLSKRGKVINKMIAATLDSRRQTERARLEAHQSLLDAEQQRIHYQHEIRRLEKEREAQYEWFNWVNSLVPGDHVFVRKFERNARIVRVQLQKQTALVTAGAVDMEVRLNELSKPLPA